MNKMIHRHVFAVNPQDNGGEQVLVCTEFFDNGDPGKEGIFINQKISLESYCNSAEFFLCGAPFTPEVLRNLASQIEKAEEVAFNKKEIKNGTGRLERCEAI